MMFLVYYSLHVGLVPIPQLSSCLLYICISARTRLLAANHSSCHPSI